MKPWEKYNNGPWTAISEKQEMKEFDLPFEFSKRQAKTALGLMTTFDTKREMKVLRENYPELKFYKDKDDKIVVDGSAYGAEPGYLNKPGISMRDLADVGFNVAAFAPAGKVLSGMAKVPRLATSARAGVAGLLSGGTQAGIEGVNAATGGFESLGDSAANVGVAAGVGSAFEGVFAVAAPKMKSALARFRMNLNRVTPEVREEVKRAFEEAGVKSVDDQTIFAALNEFSKRTGTKLKDISRQGADESLVNARSSVLPGTTNQADDLGREFGVNLTRGQRTQNTDLLRQEDRLRQGVYGEKPQNILTKFDQAQDGQIAAARAEIQRRIGGQGIDRAQDAGESLISGVSSRANILNSQIDDAYQSVGDAFIKPDGVKAILQNTRNAIRGVEYNPRLEQTSQLLEDIAKQGKIFRDFGPNQIKPFHIQKIEQFRQRINNAVGAAKDNTDRRQLLVMKAAFDKSVDDAIEGALFSGDDKALEALKGARGLFREYAKKFMPNDIRTKSGRNIADNAGRYVENLIYKNPTREEAINYIFGTSKLAKKDSVAIVQRLRDVVGDSSQEWHSLREAAFLRLTGAGEGLEASTARMFSKRLTDAVNGDGRSLMLELFSPDEVKMFERFARLMRTTDPFGQPGARQAYNASKTSYENASNLRNLMAMIMRFSVGYDAAAAAGYGAAQIAKPGVRAAKTAVGTRAPSRGLFDRYKYGGLPVSYGLSEAQGS